MLLPHSSKREAGGTPSRMCAVLDPGAGPDLSLGGLFHMRRPAQTRSGPAAARGRAPLFPDLLSMAVLYNSDPADGGGSAPPAPVPSPADVAARSTQQPPAAPAPVLPTASNGDDQVLIDHRTNAPMTQTAFAKIMAKENAKGRRAALRELAESAGIPFTGLVSSDPDDADVNRLVTVLKDAETARQAQLSDEQRRNEELAAREQAIADREAKAKQREEDAARRDRQSLLQSSLVRLGAVDTEDEPNLQDALALLERELANTSDADASAVATAAENLKKRRPGLFGAAQPAQALPPAPSGGPAGGGAPRPAPAEKDAIRRAARQRAIDRGLRSDDAA